MIGTADRICLVCFMKEDEMGRSCGRNGEKKMHIQFSWGNLKERDQLKNLGVGGMIILKCMLWK